MAGAVVSSKDLKWGTLISESGHPSLGSRALPRAASPGERKSISETGQLSESDVTRSVCEITLRLAPVAPEVLPRSTAVYILI